jgi:hypothetical protein
MTPSDDSSGRAARPEPEVGMGELGRRTFHLFAPYWSRVAVIAVSLVVIAGLGVTNLLLVKVVFDRAGSSRAARG